MVCKDTVASKSQTLCLSSTSTEGTESQFVEGLADLTWEQKAGHGHRATQQQCVTGLPKRADVCSL